MSMTSHLLRRAAVLWKGGNKAEARKVLQSIIYNEKDNESAWYWYIYTQETDREKIAALETYLSICPRDERARQALQALQEQEKQNMPSPEAPVAAARAVEAAPAAPKHRPAKWAFWKALFGSIFVLGMWATLFTSAALLSRNYILQAEYEVVAARERSIARDYQQLSAEFEALNSKFATLLQQYNSLVARYNDLSQQHSALADSQSTLHAELDQLAERYNNLAGNYGWLDSVAVKPPFIYVHDRTVDLSFYDPYGQLTYWTIPFSDLEREMERGAAMREEIFEQGWYITTIYTASGEEVWVADYSGFITPELFQGKMASVYQNSASADEFISTTWRIMGQLVNYVDEEEEIPRFPYETLLAGGGDCEDLAILFASLIKAAPVHWTVDLVYVDSEHILNPQLHNHLIVFIDTGEKTYLVETTNDQEMQPYINGVVGWPASILSSRDEQDRQAVYLR